MCASRILTGKPGAQYFMIFLVILFGHRQRHNHPLSIEGGQLDFAPESKDFYTSAAIIARSPVLYVITRFDTA